MLKTESIINNTRLEFDWHFNPKGLTWWATLKNIQKKKFDKRMIKFWFRIPINKSPF